MNVVDIGAHIGMYTILAAEKVGKTGKVVAIEPELKNYKQLTENIDLNGLKNIIFENIALADYNGSGKLYLGSFSESHSLIVPEDKNSYIEVPVKTLDNLLEELNIKKVDIIKIDTEGAEVPILKGAEKTLKANPGCRVILASYHYPSQIKEVSQFLNDRGFKTKVYKDSIVITV
jgi:FkbM family methyltransferase